MNVTDIRKMGVNYNVIDDDGQKLKQIKVIQHTDFLASVLGEYNEEFYENSDDYIASSMKKLSGFVPLHEVYWYTCSEADYEVTEVLYECMTSGYSYAIVEIVEPEESALYYDDDGELYYDDDDEFFNKDDDDEDEYYD